MNGLRRDGAEETKVDVVGTVVRLPDDHEVKQQFEAAENKYQVELVADESILTVGPSDVKVAVSITGLQLSG